MIRLTFIMDFRGIPFLKWFIAAFGEICDVTQAQLFEYPLYLFVILTVIKETKKETEQLKT